jgi:hypothetical protein
MTITGTYGLVDHCDFDMDGTGAVQSINVTGSANGSDGGYTPWTRPLSLGTVNAVYIEDSTFDHASQNETTFDCYGGARVVFRYNTVTRQSTGCHGTDSGARRSAFSIEQYNNTFINNSGSILRAFTLRGGTLLNFNNTYGGSTAWTGITPMVYRATIAGSYSWEYCDGTAWDIGSANFTAQASRQNVPFGTGARFSLTNPDLVCTGSTTGDCARPFDGAGAAGYPCRDQPGRTFGQALAPLYEWNNGASIHHVPYDGGCTACNGLPITTWLLVNRDYYNYTTTFNGTVGVGQGTLATRPATCTPLTAYFATDVGPQGTLYQCSAPNTWSVYYTPLTYPHPLSVGASASTPTGVVITK